MKTSLTSLCLLLSLPALGQAAQPLTFYGGVGVEQQEISVNEVDFDVNMIALHVGAWVREGVGFELEYGTAIDDDSQGTVSLEHTQMLRYGLRLMSPPSASKTVIYVLLGGASSSIDMQTSGNGQPGEESFNGYHAGIGIGTQLNPKLQFDLSYNNYQVDKSFDISGIRLNLEYTLGAAAR